MWRTQLAEDHGMLFMLDAQQPACFWMLNTPLALSIAFFDQQWQLLEYFDMTPWSRQIHCAQHSAHYAVEVNQGWFQQRQIEIGQPWQLNWLNDFSLNDGSP
ncbi:DUF192 domain-containing protein [Nitrincola tapanii]|uniref:DUF192 domain-containing protein n=2 Tax=Nitrincola tapanii TaxID=1708751 RepID=A0A5A9W0K4_9GAMM|nr:DUF192 domain-containing protein [Nitrincola tapanii]